MRGDRSLLEVGHQLNGSNVAAILRHGKLFQLLDETVLGYLAAQLGTDLARATRALPRCR